MIKNRITLKQLEAFVFVADMGTFRKAAAALNTTQPNISVRIATMEETLGVVLMHRDAGAIQLTDKGRDVLAAARDVLRASETLLEVADRKDLIEERLRLGVTELIASTWLHGFLRAFRKVYPAVRVELTVDLAHQLENHLTTGQLDLALLNGPFRTKSGGMLTLDTCDYGWVAAPELAAALKGDTTLPALHALGIVSHGKETQASGALQKHLKACGLRGEEVVHSSSLTSCLHMAIDGMGVALLPCPLFAPAVAEGRLIELCSDWTPEPLRFSARYDDRRAPGYVVEAAHLAAEACGTPAR